MESPDETVSTSNLRTRRPKTLYFGAPFLSSFDVWERFASCLYVPPPTSMVSGTVTLARDLKSSES
jgi:hypothetical protein